MALHKIKAYAQKGFRWIFPEPDKAEDGRDQWPSRAAFLLAAMGGCAGQGNLLRYPSVVYNNYGLQWFIPYLLAVFLIAIPALVLEISIGQAYRGGSVIAFNNINGRLKGIGLGPVFVSLIVVQYFTVNLAWIMNYFRNSFTSPLPWENRIEDFYNNDVVANPAPIAGSLTDGGNNVASYTSYPAIGLIGETVGWSAFIWFLIWFSIFRGVGMTGRVVYFTMGLPIITTIIFVGRALSLDNAGAGVKLLWGTWRGDQLASGTVWQTAVGQVFFSTGIGFGYFTSYASYNQKHSNAVMDAVLICGSNVLFENFAAFAIFGVVGFLRRWPQDGERLGAFVVGFLTLPEAVLQMPGANFWAILLFLTLIVLGFSSAFVMLDVVATLLVDSGVKYSRPTIVTALTLVSFLMCLPYCTEFGYYLLDGVDRWINNIVLIFVVFGEVVSATTVYRWTDITGRVGLPAFIVYNLGYFGGLLIGVTVAHGVGSAGPGAGAGFGSFVVCTLVAGFIAKAPASDSFGIMSKVRGQASQLWYLAFYSGNQLRRDLNLVVGGGKNWNIPSFMPVLLRYVSGPVLAIIFSFAFPEFHTLRYDPMMITGFILSILGMVGVLLGFVMPRYYDAFIPAHRRDEGTQVTVLNEPTGQLDTLSVVSSDIDGGESGSRDKSLSEGVRSGNDSPELRAERLK
ncbi:SNF-domain-containing protein [Aureobasidium pullulans]|uniref:SNF-domain-containing protein n=1 Tax=Aureobasidium pullulans TaxID=5580 RepID=A0A4V4IR81_AURPU|nr:SNF-domain-containing protein [Aureobasidium pullulans]THW72837.1 SNF-domain-containing protein [Aureobasidium pullulans]THY46486.1 SNF-domain-containing protein [Aureobasidium pullulans]